MTAPNGFSCTSLTGGGSGALDSISGSNITNNDFAIVTSGGYVYFYRADTSGGAGESSPEIIVPDTNPGSINWELQDIAVEGLDAARQIPAGSVIGFFDDATSNPDNNIPTGFLHCDGTSGLSTTTYADLFAAIGYMFGGSGSTFTLPDLRGRFLRGWAEGQSTDPDRATRTNRGDGQTGDLPGTKQGSQYTYHAHNIAWSASGYLVDAGSNEGYIKNTGSTATDSQGGNETRPINTSIMWCIRY